MSLCKFVGTVTKYSQKYLHALFIVFATNDEAHEISTRIPEFRRSGGGDDCRTARDSEIAEPCCLISSHQVISEPLKAEHLLKNFRQDTG